MAQRTAHEHVRAWHRECNAYCGDGRHAGVVYCDGDDDLVARRMVDFVETLVGGRYVAHYPAPEARPSTRRVTLFASGRVDRDRLMSTPWLVLWTNRD